MNALIENLAQLGTYEKLQLVEDLWDSIDQNELPALTDEVHQELVRRAAWADANPGHELTIMETASRLGVRL
ncbi:MAG: addiction module protein [Pseudomonadota bacterium]